MPAELVAHRGLPTHFPENSLLGFQAAIQAGARWLETDVQISADLVPLLYHDGTAKRLSDLERPVSELTLAELQLAGNFCPQQFGHRFRGNPVNTLSQLIHYLRSQTEVRLFVEVKKESLAHHGLSAAVERVLHAAEGLERDRIVMISFDFEAIRQVKSNSGHAVGWIMQDCEGADDFAQQERLLRELQPGYVFGRETFWLNHGRDAFRGSWKRAVYTVNDPADLMRFEDFDYVETDCFRELVAPRS